MQNLPIPKQLDDLIALIGPAIGALFAAIAVLGAVIGISVGSSDGSSGGGGYAPAPVTTTTTKPALPTTPATTPKPVPTITPATTTKPVPAPSTTPAITTKSVPSTTTKPVPSTITITMTSPTTTTTKPPAPALLPPVVAAPATGDLVVNQGDTIYMKNAENTMFGSCTIGYLNKDQRAGLTASHCMQIAPGNPAPPTGVTVYNDQWEPLGQTYGYNPYFSEGNQTRHDVALIHFSDNVTVGNNIYSGDTIIDYPKNRADYDRICIYGARTKKVSCTDREPAYNDRLFNAYISDVTFGDSGGVMWAVAPDGTSRGIIGTLVGFADEDLENIEVGAMRTATIDYSKFNMR